LAGSLAEGLAAHLADVRRRVPGARPVLQLDEPSLAAVLHGRVRTASGYRTYRAVDRAVVEATLRELIGAAGMPVVVHTCAPEVPFGLLRAAGAAGVSFDFDLLTERDWDAVGEAAEAGTALLAGVVPGTDTALSDPAGSVSGVRALWRRLGLAPGALGSSVAVTPSCGLAGASPAYARAALVHCAKAARSLVDNPE
ncbi:MAG: methionine synthase, partial [Streptomyces sp.]|nr:methionine synthase [Streptomyces sp.]